MIKTFNGMTPRVASTAFVSEVACVVGDVEIGDNSSVWPGAVVRGDFARIRIGRNSQIEDKCVVHGADAVTIGDNVHVGHGAVIHCSRIGNHVLVGMKATLLDGVEIGDRCVIAANSVVSPGTRVSDDSFVAGVPAKVKGRTTATQLALVEEGVEGYVAMGSLCRRQGL